MSLFRNIFIAAAIIATPVCDAYASKRITAAIYKAWGSPTYNSDPWSKSLGNDNIPDKTFWIMPKKVPANANDEAVVMIYAARRIVEHGGYFCATQPRSRNKGGGKPKSVWTQYMQPSGNVDATCFWLCEPGYTGTNCAAGRATTASQCNYTKLSVETVTDGISYWESGGYDSNSIEGNMYDSDGFLYYEVAKNTRDESDLLVAAKSFLPSGHGIEASVVQVTAHCGFWTLSDYSDSHTNCSGGTSDLTVTALGSSFITKTLCMPGFDGPGCTTSVCTECEEPLKKFNTTTGACTDCIENYNMTSTGECIKCGENQVFDSASDTCIECKATEYPKDGKCLPRQTISNQAMYNCWPNSDATDFARCVKADCEDGMVLKCMTDDRLIGEKTCSGKKWGKCVATKKKK